MRHIYVMVDVKDWDFLIDLPRIILRWQEPYDSSKNVSPNEIGMIFVKNFEGIESCIHYITTNIQPERLNPEDHFVDHNDMVCDSLNTANK